MEILGSREASFRHWWLWSNCVSSRLIWAQVGSTANKQIMLLLGSNNPHETWTKTEKFGGLVNPNLTAILSAIGLRNWHLEASPASEAQPWCNNDVMFNIYIHSLTRCRYFHMCTPLTTACCVHELHSIFIFCLRVQPWYCVSFCVAPESRRNSFCKCLLVKLDPVSMWRVHKHHPFHINNEIPI